MVVGWVGGMGRVRGEAGRGGEGGKMKVEQGMGGGGQRDSGGKVVYVDHSLYFPVLCWKPGSS